MAAVPTRPAPRHGDLGVTPTRWGLGAPGGRASGIGSPYRGDPKLSLLLAFELVVHLLAVWVLVAAGRLICLGLVAFGSFRLLAGLRRLRALVGLGLGIRLRRLVG